MWRVALKWNAAAKLQPERQVGKYSVAFDYQAAKRLQEFDTVVRKLMCICDGKDCLNEECVLDKKQVIEVVHVPKEVSFTISLCRECYTKCTGRRQMAINAVQERQRQPMRQQVGSQEAVKFYVRNGSGNFPQMRTATGKQQQKQAARTPLRGKSSWVETKLGPAMRGGRNAGHGSGARERVTQKNQRP